MSSLGVAHTTKAIVFDFTCLFTHDLKRKQKRWQDGKLKYHTFNGKIMVYDDRGNFVGESRWQEQQDLADGDEFSLDRGGAIVQVAECTGTHEQDLAELVDKRAKEVQQRRVEKTAKLGNRVGFVTPQSTAALASPRPSTGHRPLNTLIAGPARIGRAVMPTKSPYEVRHATRSSEQEGETSSQPTTSKRKRSVSPPSKLGHARALFGTQLSLSSTPSSIAQARRQVLSQRSSYDPSSVHLPQESCKESDKQSDHETTPHTACAPEGHIISQVSSKAEQQSSQPELTPKEATSTKTTSEKSAQQTQYLSDDVVLQNRGRMSSARERKRHHEEANGAEKEETRSETNRPRQQRSREAQTNCPAVIEILDVDGEERGLGEREPTMRRNVNLGTKRPVAEHLASNDEIHVPTEELRRRRQKALSSGRGGQTSRLSASRPHEATLGEVRGHTDRDTSFAPMAPVVDVPRTELRIGSRKKRGLLVISERKPMNCLKSKTSSPDAQHGSACRESQLEATPADAGLCPGHDDLEDNVATSRSQGVKKKFPESFDEAESLFVQSLSASQDAESEPEAHTRYHEGDEAELEAPPKPRIARLARKSVKSREIIGYIPEAALPTIAWSSRAFDKDILEQQENADPNTTDATPRLTKPDMRIPDATCHKAEPFKELEPPFSATGKACNFSKSAETGDTEELMLSTQDDDAAFEDWLAQIPSENSGLQSETRSIPVKVRVGADEETNERIRAEHGASDVVSESTLVMEKADDGPQDASDLTLVISSGIGVSAAVEAARRPSGVFSCADTLPVASMGSVSEGEREDQPMSVDSCGAQQPNSPKLQGKVTDGRPGVERSIVLARDEDQALQPVGSQTAVLTSQNMERRAPTTVDHDELTNEESAVLVDEDAPNKRLEKTARGSPDGTASISQSAAGLMGGESGRATNYAKAPMETTLDLGSRLPDKSHAHVKSATKLRPASETASGGSAGTDKPRMLVNPATRGKKAASKAHAAGEAPRGLIQLDPMNMAPVPRQRGRSMPQPQRKRTAAALLPAFEKASGGAWSKHAEDLLGITHP